MAAQSVKLAGKQFVIVPRKEYATLRRRAQSERSGKAYAKANIKRRASRRPTPPVESYTDERVAEFLLSNSMDADDYRSACAEVRKLGLDPARISHIKPPGIE